MPLRAVVFDFDGVIANSEPLHLRAFQDVLASEHVTLTHDEYYARYLGFDDAGVFRMIGEACGAAFSTEQIAELVARKAVRMEALEKDVSVLFPGAAETIRRLARSLPLAVASGALGAEIRRVLDRAKLTACFAAIVSAEDTPASKPAPDPYLRAVQQLSASVREPLSPGDCVAVEDSVWGLESARTAGLRTVAVAQTYPPAALSAADLVVTSVHELTHETLARLWSD